jgi:hypothetical protein
MKSFISLNKESNDITRKVISNIHHVYINKQINITSIYVISLNYKLFMSY